MRFFVKAFARYPPSSFRDSLIQLVQFSPHCTLKSRGDSVVHTHRLCRIKLARGEVTSAFRYVRPKLRALVARGRARVLGASQNVPD